MQVSSTAAAGERAGRVSDAVPRRFLAGDGLRAAAALGVLVLHERPALQRRLPWRQAEFARSSTVAP